MPWLSINGWEIPIADDKPSKIPLIIGDHGRAYSGGLLGTEQAEKRQYKLRTLLLSEAEAVAVEGLLRGWGDVWQFDNSLWSAKGQQAAFARASTRYLLDGTLVASGAAGYNGGPYAAADKAIWVEEATAQIFANSGFETGDKTGWLENAGGGDGSFAVNGTAKRIGLYGAQLAGGTNGMILYQNGGANPNIYSINFAVKKPDSSPVTNADVNAYANGAAAAFDALENLGGGWYWCKKRNVARSAGGWGIKALAGVTVYVDQCLMEQKAYCTTYHEATRATEFLTIPTGLITPTEGAIWVWVYVTDVTKRQVAGQYNRLFEIPRSIGGWGITIYHESALAQWKLATRNDAGTVIGINFGDSYTPGGWYLFCTKWKAAEVKLSVNGTNRGTITTPNLPSAFGANSYVGYGDGPSNFLNTYFGAVILLPYYPTDAEELAYYNSSRPYSNLRLLDVTGDMVRRTSSKPLICRAEINDISFVQRGAATMRRIEFTLEEA